MKHTFTNRHESTKEHRLVHLLSQRPSAQPEGGDGFPNKIEGTKKGPDKPLTNPIDAKKATDNRVDGADKSVSNEMQRLYDAKTMAGGKEALAIIGSQKIGDVKEILENINIGANAVATKADVGTKDGKNLRNTGDFVANVTRRGSDWLGGTKKDVDTYATKKGQEKADATKKIDEVKKVIEKNEGKPADKLKDKPAPKVEPVKPEVAPQPRVVELKPDTAKKDEPNKNEKKPVDKAKTDEKPAVEKPGDKKTEAPKEKEKEGTPKTEGERIASEINKNIAILKNKNASREDKIAAGLAVLASMGEYFVALRNGTLKTAVGKSGKDKVETGSKTEKGDEKKTDSKNENKTEARDRLKKELQPGEDLAGLRQRKVTEKGVAETQLNKDKGDLRKSEDELSKAEDALKKETDDTKKPGLKTAVDAVKAKIASQKAAVEKQEATIKTLDADIKDLDGLKADGEKRSDEMKDKVDELLQLLTDPKTKEPLDGAKTIVETLKGMKMGIDKNYDPELGLNAQGMTALRSAAEKNGMDGGNAKLGVDSAGKVKDAETFNKFLAELYTKVKPKVTR